MNTKKFQTLIWENYRKNKRHFPWRDTINPYCIVVSEIMLQQTQVSRVLIKFSEFLKQFPDWHSLAIASTAEVLKLWSGLGYNRRALYLKKIAESVVKKYKGVFPENYGQIITLPGIGTGTAGSILAFAFNTPTVFIETNIRRVFIHHFFADKTEVSDKELFPFIEKTLDQKNPREWYYALMDYGTYLTKQVENPNKKSKHYSIQSKFAGSDRQMRGHILRLIVRGEFVNQKSLVQEFPNDDKRIVKALKTLEKEGFITRKKSGYSIK